MKFIKDHLTGGVLLGTLAVAVILCALFGGIFVLVTKTEKPQPTQMALVTVLPAPSITPSPAAATDAPVTTETPQPVEGMTIGMYVQISGTGGDGLRLRVGAGTSKEPRFLGYESEVFQIKDGPQFSDGLTWWFLEAPYDPGRSGWAAASYLKEIEGPVE